MCVVRGCVELALRRQGKPIGTTLERRGRMIWGRRSGEGQNSHLTCSGIRACGMSAGGWGSLTACGCSGVLGTRSRLDLLQVH